MNQDSQPHQIVYDGERIVAAAIIHKGVVFTGPHHATIIHYVAKILNIRPVTGQQGFVTSFNRFVDREEALQIAERNNQIVHKHGCARELFSEDLWSVPQDSIVIKAQEAEIKSLREKVVKLESEAILARPESINSDEAEDSTYSLLG